MTHSVILALPASQVTPSRHGDLPSCGTFGPASIWRRAWTVFSELRLLPVIHGACKGPRDGSQGQGCAQVGGQDSTARRDETGASDRTDRTDRTLFVTCHAALLQPLPSCVCASHLGASLQDTSAWLSKACLVHPFNGAARKSLPPLDRSCVFHSCWLESPFGS